MSIIKNKYAYNNNSISNKNNTSNKKIPGRKWKKLKVRNYNIGKQGNNNNNNDKKSKKKNK